MKPGLLVLVFFALFALLLPLNARENSTFRSEGIYKIPAMSDFNLEGADHISVSPDGKRIALTPDYSFNSVVRISGSGSPNPGIPHKEGIYIFNTLGELENILLPDQDLLKRVKVLLQEENHPVLRDYQFTDYNGGKIAYEIRERFTGAEFLDDNTLLISGFCDFFFHKKSIDDSRYHGKKFLFLIEYDLKIDKYQLHLLDNKFADNGKALVFLQDGPFVFNPDNGLVYFRSLVSNYAKDSLGIDKKYIISSSSIYGDFVSEAAVLPEELADIDLSLRFYDFSWGRCP
jgi:hypothetical protein